MIKNKVVKSLIFIVVIILIFVAFFMFRSTTNVKYYNSLNELNGEKIGIATGSTFDSIIKKKLKNVDLKYYDNAVDRISALRNGKIAAYVTDDAMANEAIKNNNDLTILNEPIGVENYAYAINPNNPELKEKVDKVLLGLKKDGTLDYLQKKWMGNNESKKKLENIKLSGKNGTINFGTLATSAPFSYLKDDKIVGYDIDLMLYICDKLDYSLNINVLDWNGLLTAVNVGKVDMAGCGIIVTKEREKSMLFSAPNYEGNVVAVVLKNTISDSNVVDDIKQNFVNTFVKEDRYKLFINGTLTTLEISILSIIFGTILGVIIGIMRVSNKKNMKFISKIFISFMQGMPITVLLLIMYYLIFVKTPLSAIAVSIITFSIYLSAYVAEMIRGGYEAINKNQIQAAYSIGFTKYQTVKYIIFPQIISYIIPIYKGQVISTIKSTSIVGYIAIMDLTKIGDLIRSRTFDAFFSLIAVALIYLLICIMFQKLLEYIEKKVNKRKQVIV